jgi:hypothetical protein
MLMNGALVNAGAAVAASFDVLIPRLRRRRSAAALEGGESLDDGAFYGRHYAESQLPVDLRKLNTVDVVVLIQPSLRLVVLAWESQVVA